MNRKAKRKSCWDISPGLATHLAANRFRWSTVCTCHDLDTTDWLQAHVPSKKLDAAAMAKYCKEVAQGQ